MTTMTLPAVATPPAAAAAKRPTAAQRERRAAVAQRLMDLAPRAVEAIDWDALDSAPDSAGAAASA